MAIIYGMEYRQCSYTKYKIEYHFVWATKYCYHVLTGDVSLRMRELVRQTCDRFDIHILRGVVSKDHVHLLVSASPNISPSDIMRRVKGRASRKIMGESFLILRNGIWGGVFGLVAICVSPQANSLKKRFMSIYLTILRKILMVALMLSKVTVDSMLYELAALSKKPEELR